MATEIQGILFVLILEEPISLDLKEKQEQDKI